MFCVCGQTMSLVIAMRVSACNLLFVDQRCIFPLADLCILYHDVNACLSCLMMTPKLYIITSPAHLPSSETVAYDLSKLLCLKVSATRYEALLLPFYRKSIEALIEA